MPLSPNDAANTLGDMEKVGRRSVRVHSYAHTSPYLILWGLIWIIAYGASGAMPRYTHFIWPILTVVGSVASFIVGMRARDRSSGGYTWRFIGTFLAFFVFISATVTILRPVDGNQVGAFVPLVVALMYSLFGIWRGARFLVAGIGIAALTLGGYFYLPAYFNFWMALIGGGSLILAGIWLRRV